MTAAAFFRLLPGLAAALLGLALAACGAAAGTPAPALSPPATPAAAPVLERTFPRTVLPGASLQLIGTGFGERQAEGAVTLRGVSVEVLSWAGEQVRVRVPLDFPPGASAAAVTAAGVQSNPVSLLVNDPVIAPGVREVPCHRDAALCSVYLPPGYDSDPARRFPTVYHFQGILWSNRMVPQESSFAAFAGEYGFIVVFDWQLQDKGELLELVRETDARFRTIPRAAARGVWLTSASGRLGLQAASEQPDWIGAVDGSHACLGSFAAEGARRLKLRLDIGTEDTTCGARLQAAHMELTALGIPHEYAEHAGAHEAATMFGERTMRGVLDFFKRALRD